MWFSGKCDWLISFQLVCFIGEELVIKLIFLMDFLSNSPNSFEIYFGCLPTAYMKLIIWKKFWRAKRKLKKTMDTSVCIFILSVVQVSGKKYNFVNIVLSFNGEYLYVFISFVLWHVSICYQSSFVNSFKFTFLTESCIVLTIITFYIFDCSSCLWWV